MRWDLGSLLVDQPYIWVTGQELIDSRGRLWIFVWGVHRQSINVRAGPRGGICNHQRAWGSGPVFPKKDSSWAPAGLPPAGASSTELTEGLE